MISRRTFFGFLSALLFWRKAPAKEPDFTGIEFIEEPMPVRGKLKEVRPGMFEFEVVVMDSSKQQPEYLEGPIRWARNDSYSTPTAHE